MKLLLITLAVVAAVILAVACDSTTTTHAVSAAAACQAALHHLYVHLGGAAFGPARFAAAVNALTFQGTTPAACHTLTHGEVMRLAAAAAR